MARPPNPYPYSQLVTLASGNSALLGPSPSPHSQPFTSPFTLFTKAPLLSFIPFLGLQSPGCGWGCYTVWAPWKPQYPPNTTQHLQLGCRFAFNHLFSVCLLSHFLVVAGASLPNSVRIPYLPKIQHPMPWDFTVSSASRSSTK